MNERRKEGRREREGGREIYNSDEATLEKNQLMCFNLTMCKCVYQLSNSIKLSGYAKWIKWIDMLW